MTGNLKAFMDMIAYSEIGPALLAASDNGYNVLVGSTPSHPLIFDDYSKHPHVLNSKLNSTAAGRYQIIFKTDVALSQRLDRPGFTPDDQDAKCAELIRETGAQASLDAGNFGIAVTQCSHIWASLPGAGYGQHENAIEKLRAAYIEAGGDAKDNLNA